MFASTTWPDLITLLAEFVARIGSPARLALQMLPRPGVRALSRQIMLMEAQVRARLDALFVRFASASGVAQLLLMRLAAIKPPSRRPAPASPAAELRRQTDFALHPSFASLTALPRGNLPRENMPRDVQTPSTVPSTKPRRPAAHEISTLPLARRLAALTLAVEDPDATALRLLAQRPQLAIHAGWKPPLLQDAPAAQPDEGPIEQPPARQAPLNRRQRRAAKAKDKHHARHPRHDGRPHQPDTS